MSTCRYFANGKMHEKRTNARREHILISSHSILLMSGQHIKSKTDIINLLRCFDACTHSTTARIGRMWRKTIFYSLAVRNVTLFSVVFHSSFGLSFLSSTSSSSLAFPCKILLCWPTKTSFLVLCFSLEVNECVNVAGDVFYVFNVLFVIYKDMDATLTKMKREK